MQSSRGCDTISRAIGAEFVGDHDRAAASGERLDRAAADRATCGQRRVKNTRHIGQTIARFMALPVLSLKVVSTFSAPLAGSNERMMPKA